MIERHTYYLSRIPAQPISEDAQKMETGKTFYVYKSADKRQRRRLLYAGWTRMHLKPLTMAVGELAVATITIGPVGQTMVTPNEETRGYDVTYLNDVG